MAGGAAPGAPAAMTSEEARRKAEEVRKKMEKVKAMLEAKRKRKLDGALTATKAGPAATEARPAATEARPAATEARPAATTSSAPSPAPPGRPAAGQLNPYLAHLVVGGQAERERERGPSEGIFDPRFDDEDPGAAWERKRALREKKAFKIVPKGKYVRAAELQRARQALASLRQEERDGDARRHYRKLLRGAIQDSGGPEVAKAAGAAAGAENAAGPAANEDLATAVFKMAQVPDMEWWDKAFLPAQERRKKRPRLGQVVEDGETRNAKWGLLSLENERTHALVQHPALLEPLVPRVAPRPVKLYLTREERKRKRKQTRREREQEKQDKIAAGLLPPPEPKLRLGNMMRVLGDRVVADPSRFEAQVLEQVQERIRNHQARNEAAKKTPQERYEKALQKIEEDSRGPPTVVVYRVAELNEPPELAASNRFKMDANAQKLGLTGCVVAVAAPSRRADGTQVACSLVVAEGGPKAQARFEKQMLKRIKFPAGPGDAAGCVKVWQGMAAARAFPKRLEFHDVESGPRARGVLAKRGVAQYWDLALAFDQV